MTGWWDAYGGGVVILVVVAFMVAVGIILANAEDDRPNRGRIPAELAKELAEDCEPASYYGGRGGC